MDIAPPIIAPTTAAPVIEAIGLTKLYGDFPAVTDVSFAVRPGEVIGLVGPNGAGKTTTLRCLAGIIPATRGAVRICGRDMAADPVEAKRHLAFFSDEPRLFDYLTVDQHLNFTARIYGVANYEAVANPLLEELEIADKRDKLPGELSRGMKQKLAIACGLLHSPEVIFFDEPLTGLDPMGIRRMKDSILRRARTGAAILISSHLLHLLEEVCSHVLILKNGKKIIDGTLAEVRQKFSEQSGDASFEEIFFRATGEGQGNAMIAGALVFYQWNSWRNRLLTRIRRLRQPKYLFGAIVGALYFYWYFVRNLARGGRGMPMAQGHSELAPMIGSTVLLVMVLMAWIMPHARAALAFTEAEIAFLFPAPVSRRALIHFKLLRSQTVILFSALFLTLIGRSWGGGYPVARTVGWWVVFATFNLHLMGSSFVLTRLMDRGLSTWRRRLLILALVGAFVVGVVLWLRQAVPVPPSLDDRTGLAWMAPYLEQVFHSGPLPYLLFPFRLVVAPYFATNTLQLLTALGPALLVMALHYFWVIRSDVAFEEASIELSKKTAERVTAIRSGNWQAARRAAKKRRPPFKLRPLGPPAVGLLWKNLISAGNLVTARVWLLLVWVAVFCGFMMGTTRIGHGWGEGLGFLALILTGMSLFWGPQMLRNDLRQDLPATDVLKMFPLPGWQLVLGEVMAPVVILTGVQWLLLLLALFLFPAKFGTHLLPLSGKAGIALSAAIVLPCVDLIAMLIPNAAVLFFPAWFQLGKDAPRGFETTGQQLILLFGQLLILAVSLLPAAAVFAIVYFVASLAIPPGVNLIPAGLAAAIVLLIEAGVGIKMLGGTFERFDLSEEVLREG